MKLISAGRLKELQRLAAESPRLRANDNLHVRLDDPVQRFLNALQPGTYVRPHRHSTPPKWEMLIILEGSVDVLLFDENGILTARTCLRPDGPVRGVEVPACAWHTVVALTSGTVLFELKPGPYSPVLQEDFAPWSPAENLPFAAQFGKRLAALSPGQDATPPLLAQ
jgi:cupin fold WbuC family metalloprotein